MQHNLEQKIKEVCKIESIIEYNSFLMSVSKKGTSIFDVPAYYITNKMILASFTAKTDPVVLPDRFSIEFIITKNLVFEHLYKSPEMRDACMHNLRWLISKKYKNWIPVNKNMKERKLYTFFDFYNAASEEFGGMDAICYLWLYNGEQIPILVWTPEKVVFYTLSFNSEKRLLNLKEISREEFDVLNEIRIKKEKDLPLPSYSEKFEWSSFFKKSSFPILQDGEIYEDFRQDEESGVIYDISHIHIFYVPNDVREFEIPEGVESFSQRCFANNGSITKIVFPSTLKSIPLGAFTNCSALKEINTDALKVSNSIEVDSNVFLNCFSLKQYDKSKIIIKDYNEDKCISE